MVGSICDSEPEMEATLRIRTQHLRTSRQVEMPLSAGEQAAVACCLLFVVKLTSLLAMTGTDREVEEARLHRDLGDGLG